MEQTTGTAVGTIPQGRWLHILPVVFIMYTIAYVDRTNISMAIPSMSRDLHLTSTQAGSAAGIFFWGYLLLQIPGGYLAEHWSAKRFVSVLLVAWGACSVGCAFVHTPHQLLVMRLLLGVTVGGVWPATLVLIASWFPRSEHARANAYWMLCQPASVIFTAPLSGWILGHWNWRVLLATEGALPFVWLLIWWLMIYDHPRGARWISDSECDHLESTLSREAADLVPVTPEPILRTLVRPKVFFLTTIQFVDCVAGYSYLFWMPTALKRIGTRSDLVVGLLFAVPYLLAAAAMVINSRHSDRTHERRLHTAVPLLLGGLFLLAAVRMSGSSPSLTFLFLCLTGPCSYMILGPFWSIPSETFSPATLGTAMGVINAVGSLGGYVGPLAIGYIAQRTGNVYSGLNVAALVMIVGFLVLLFFPDRWIVKSHTE